MTPRRLLLGVATGLTALLLQTAVVARLPLPGVGPDLLVVLVVAFALAEGPASGAVTGFAAGLLADLVGDAELGRTALALAVAGHVAGRFADDADRSRVLPVLVVAGAAAGAVTVYALEGLLLGDPRVTAAAWARSTAGTVAYSAVLAPLVVPAVRGLVRRLDRDAMDRW